MFRVSLCLLPKILISNLQNLNKQFLNSRKDDPAIKDRESALQALELAYFKYREITRNLEEGFKVRTLFLLRKSYALIWDISFTMTLQAS